MEETKETAPAVEEKAAPAAEAPKQEAGVTPLQVKAKLAEKGLDKFKDVDALAESYISLEKQFHDSRLAKDANEEQLLAKTKDFYSKLESKSVLDGELGEWSTELAADTGLPAQMVDLITAKVAAKATERQSAQRKEEVNALLKDEQQLKYMQAAVDERPGYEEQLNSRLSAGHVTAEELRHLAEIGKGLVDSGKGMEAQVSQSKATAEQELMTILDNPRHAYFDRRHANYEAAQDTVAKLKNVLRIK